MSENVALLRRGYELFAAGDFDALLELVADDVVVERPGGQPALHGRAEYRAFLEPDAFESQRFEPLEFVENGDRVLVRVHSHARGAGSGVEWDEEWFHVWTMRDGRGAHLVATTDEAEARLAAGLANVPRP